MSTPANEQQKSTTNAVLTNTSGLTDADLGGIKDFQIGELPKTSNYIRPFRATFTDQRNGNPVKRIWDAVDAHVCH